MTVLHVHEIRNDVDLCLHNGMLNTDAVGWSRKPHHRCNLSGAWPRKKRWNYWCVTSERFLFSVAVASLDYAGSVFAYLLDLETGEFVEDTILIPLGRGLSLPGKVEADIRYENRRVGCAFTYKPESIHLDLNWPAFKGKPLKANIEIPRDRTRESLNVVVPWSMHQFQFTSKQPCLPATGTIHHGDKAWNFDQGAAHACLDFGRGIWPRRIAWNWASFWTQSGSTLVGFNGGGKWTDNTGSNENGVILNGRLHKFHEPLEFMFDPKDYRSPWRIRTLFSDTVDLKLTPVFDRAAKTNLMVVRSEMHQLIGHFDGYIRVNETEIPIERAVGWAEDHSAVW